MSTALKDKYSSAFYDNFSNAVKEVIPSFSKKKFITSIFDETWDSKELKDRMRHTSFVLHQFLPEDFETAAGKIEKIITKLRQSSFPDGGIEFLFFPDYIERYGINHFDISVKAIEFTTQYITCEYAVRPFIIMYGDRMMQQMHAWSLHENHHVRRLASEGSRPRLPWAVALPSLKKDPGPVLPLLNNLKTDPSEYVRRSVANSLNDIAKDNPDIVLSIAKQWKGISRETDAIIKHGCRTLLKQGNATVLKYFGLNAGEDIKLSAFTIINRSLHIGEALSFSFSLKNEGRKIQAIRLEYGIYYLRQNGLLSKKVFKISEKSLQPGEQVKILRKQSFRIITTRKFYPGKHKLSIIINGRELKAGHFELFD